MKRKNEEKYFDDALEALGSYPTPRYKEVYRNPRNNSAYSVVGIGDGVVSLVPVKVNESPVKVSYKEFASWDKV